MPSPGYRVSGKEVEVRGSGSRHHQLCGCCNLQLIQSHVAPSHGPPARVLSPFIFSAKSLLLPKPCGKKKHSKITWSSLLSFRIAGSSPFPSELCGPLHSLFTSPETRGPLPIYLLQNLVVLSFYFSTSWPPSFPLRTVWFSLFPSEPHGPLFTSPKLPDPLPSPLKPHGPLSIYLLQNLEVLPLYGCLA